MFWCSRFKKKERNDLKDESIAKIKKSTDHFSCKELGGCHMGKTLLLFLERTSRSFDVTPGGSSMNECLHVRESTAWWWLACENPAFDLLGSFIKVNQQPVCLYLEVNGRFYSLFVPSCVADDFKVTAAINSNLFWLQVSFNECFLLTQLTALSWVLSHCKIDISFFVLM